MKKSTLFLMSLVGMLLVFAGSIWAETTNQYRNQYQNRNQLQNRRQKQSLVCQNLVPGELIPLVGYTVEECTYDGLTLKKNQEIVKVYGLGPVSYWESYLPPVSRPSTGEVVTVEYMVNETAGKNILFSLAHEDGAKIQLRSTETGCPLWR
jgi:hypothetical protein